MKKIVAMTVAFAMALSMSVFAVSANGDGVYEYRTGNVTIVFGEDTELTAEQRQSIINAVAAENNSSAAARKNIICSVFGHKYDDEGYNMTFIIHEAREKDPRCAEQIRQIRTCSRCDQLTTTVIYSKAISCCPEK